MAEKHVKIIARTAAKATTFRRCGIAFTDKETEYTVTESQLSRLEAEPMLSVKVVPTKKEEK